MRNRLRQKLGRPRLCRRIRFDPRCNYFKPAGLRLQELDIVELTKEEVEALRLKNLKNYDQVKCAREMKTSQSTLQRILTGAYKKISQALVEGRAIKIVKH